MKKVTKKPATKEATKSATTKKAVAKKATSKKAAKGTKKTAPKKAAKKSGITKAQERILLILSKTKRPFTKAQIVEEGAEKTSFGGQTGLLDPDKRDARDAVKGPSLLTLQFVRAKQEDIGGKDVVSWTITKSGRAALAKL